jgi:flagellar basal body P-ring formation protein FlgA
MRAFKYAIMTLMCFCGWCLSGQVAAMQRTETDMQSRHTLTRESEKQQTLPELKFREIFHQYLCESMGKDPEDIALSRLKITGNHPLAAGELAFQVFQKSKGIPKGYVRLAVIVSVDGVSGNEVGLSAWVDVFGSVVCASRTLNKGEIVRHSDVYLSRKNISRMSANIITEKSKAVGLSVKNRLHENACLKEYMLKRMPTLERGEFVTILAELGGLRVTTPGRTLERGFSGDLIRVQNTMSKKRIYARIVDDSTVEVDF